MSACDRHCRDCSACEIVSLVVCANNREAMERLRHLEAEQLDPTEARQCPEFCRLGKETVP